MIASHTLVPPHRRLVLAGASTALVCGLSLALAVTSSPARAAATDVDLGTSGRFAVLAGAGIKNIGDTTIAKQEPTDVTGDVGSFSDPSITGAGPGANSITTVGMIRNGDLVVQGAKDALVTAYNKAASAPTTAPITGDLAGRTLVAGTYTSASSMGLSGTLTLDGANDPNSVFIFQVGSALNTSASGPGVAGAEVRLTNGARACNVFWQVESSATFGTGTKFVGNVLALTAITAETGASFEGRLLARNAAVTLDNNTFTVPYCAATATTPPPATTTPAPSTTTPSPGGVAPAPTATPTRRAGDSRNDDDRDGGDGGGSGDDGGSDDSDGTDSGTSTDGGTSTTGTSSGTGTGIPDAGGPSGLLAPAGVIAVLVGAGLVTATRPRRGLHRA